MRPFNVGPARRVRATDKAILVDLDLTGCMEWVPISQIHDDSEVWESGDGEGDLVVSVWFAEQKEWDL